MRTLLLLIPLLLASDLRAADELALGAAVLVIEEGALRAELREARIGDRELLVIRAELPADATFSVRATETPAPLASLAGSGSVVAINGGFYDGAGRAMGLVVEDGRTVTPLRRGGGSGVLIRERSGFRVVHRSQVPDAGVLQAVQSIDRVVARGASLIGAGASDARDARSAVATFADGSARLYSVFAAEAVTSRSCDAAGCTLRLGSASTSTGVSLRELAAMLVADGAQAALNLDGGFSTSFEAHLGRRALRVVGYRPTINALVARP